MNPSAPITDEQLREDMIAYLDGELDSEETLRIEQRLASDPGFAEDLRQLQQSFELLDELPQHQVNETFAATTVEMIAVEARKVNERCQATEPRRRLLRNLALAASVCLAMITGYAAMVLLLGDPNAQLLENLSVIEHLDEYQQVESMEFLQGLRESGLFENKEPTPNQSASSPGGGHAS